MKYKTKFLKIKNIAGMFYSSGTRKETLIIYALGAPICPDQGNLPDAKIIMKYKVDLFVPDYIGYGRSEDRFTPINCIRTLLHLFKWFTGGVTAKNHYENSSLFLKYQRIIFIGKSFGGTYVPILPRFNKHIQELAIFCPVVDSKSCGSIKGEESNEDFLRSMKYDGYRHLYRGILDKIWGNHLENKDDLSPMDNILHLKNAKLFIAHGKLDRCVHYSKSVVYFKKIQKAFSNKENFKIKLYPRGEHGTSTTNKASADFLDWLQVKKNR